MRQGLSGVLSVARYEATSADTRSCSYSRLPPRKPVAAIASTGKPDREGEALVGDSNSDLVPRGGAQINRILVITYTKIIVHTSYFDQINRYDYNNGAMQNNLTYDNQLNLEEIAHGSLAKQTYSFHAHSGNLDHRIFDNFGSSTSNNEYFNYDDFDRLVKTNWHDGTNLVTKHDYNYLANGNIDTKTDCGDYVYGTGQAQHQLTNITSPVTPTISFKHLSFVYNTLKRIETIHENGFTGHHYEFTYGNNSERVMMTYTHSSNPSYTRYYQDNYDRQEESGSSNYKEWSYVYAPTGLAAVYFNNNGSASLLYVNTDHLGSPIMVTNSSGSVVAEYSFDSWGRRRDPADWNKYKSFTTPDILIRGYTGHEMLDEVGLVNMNARLYDPVLGRMLQTDAYVQEPSNLQNFNRYTYVWNNPVKYTDPTGDIIAFTDCQYEFWKYVSPVAFKVNVNFSSEGPVVGLDGSFGVPQCMPVHIRAQPGVSYHFGDDYNGYRGWEGRYGAEAGVTVGGVVLKSTVTYYDFEGSKFDQMTNKITIGTHFINIQYENDFMFGLPADGGDRYRTAALRLSIGDLNTGFNLYTGDPGLTDSEREKGPVNGQLTYLRNSKGNNPDEFRLGAAYVGYKGFRIGSNSEQNRHQIQNKFAHDKAYYWAKGEKLPHFAILPGIRPELYWSSGTGTGNTLW